MPVHAHTTRTHTLKDLEDFHDLNLKKNMRYYVICLKKMKYGVSFCRYTFIVAIFPDPLLQT